MRIEILGTESLGVRGLCCAVHTRHRDIVIDPGLSLGYLRHGLLPHPRQVAAGETTARRIVQQLAGATDVVFSHYHGDHIPLANANPFQLPLNEMAHLLKRPRLWGKTPSDEPARFADRCHDLETAAGRPICYCDGRSWDLLTFSEAMPHGHRDAGLGRVMMSRIEDDDEVFVHASDIQILDDEPVSVILGWSPDILLVSGPPLYRRLSSDLLVSARKRVLRLSREIPCCIIDHHLLRSRLGFQWLDELQAATGNVLQCAADYMQVDRRPLEADRTMLYDMEPVPPSWHQSYQRPALAMSEAGINGGAQKKGGRP